MKKSIFLCGLLLAVSNAQVFNVSTTSQFRTALEDAALNGQDDTIVLAQGTYKTTDDGLGLFSYDSFEDYNLTIKSNETDSSLAVLDGNNNTSVFRYNNEKGTLFLENVTIQNANNDTYALVALNNLIISNVTVKDNNTGGIYVDNSLDIKNSKITHNYYEGSMTGVGAKAQTINVYNSIITHNISTGEGHGGGLYGAGKVYVDNSEISYNETGRKASGSLGSGGGIRSNIVEVKNSIINGNKTGGYGGGGIYAKYDLKISNSEVTNNKQLKNSGGGGIVVGRSLHMENSLVSQNQSVLKAGGIYLDSVSGKSYIVNSIIKDNKTIDDGMSTHTQKAAGILYVGNGGLDIINSIIQNNTLNIIKNSAQYSELYANNPINIMNSYVSGDSLLSGGNLINNIIDMNSLTFSTDTYMLSNYVDYRVFEDTSYKVLKSGNIQPNTSIANEINLDQNNQPTSNTPTINQGLDLESSTFSSLFSSEEEYKEILSYLKTDILGNQRVFDSAIDIGPYEFGAPTYTGTAPQVTISKVNGDEKVYSTISFNISTLLESNRTIKELYIDKGIGNFEQVDTQITSFDVVFDTAGSKSLRVKVVDSAGESVEKNFTVDIYDLTTVEAIEYGKQQCIQNPQDCGIEQSTVNSLDKNFVDSLSAGWHMIGTSKQLDLSATDILNSTELVWYYDNSTQSWKAYSNSYNDSILLDKRLNILPANSGFWIKK